METRYWLGLGSNLGDRGRALRGAVAWLREHGFVVEAASAVYETAPREVEDQPDFLNAACRVRTAATPSEVLSAAKRLEEGLGRVPGPRYGPRAVDCDLLLWSGGAWREPGLEIPHPRLVERLFALRPLLDLDPDAALPDGTPLAAFADAIPPADQPVRRAGLPDLLG